MGVPVQACRDLVAGQIPDTLESGVQAWCTPIRLMGIAGQDTDHASAEQLGRDALRGVAVLAEERVGIDLDACTGSDGFQNAGRLLLNGHVPLHVGQDRPVIQRAEGSELVSEILGPHCPVGKFDQEPACLADRQSLAGEEAIGQIGQQLLFHAEQERYRDLCTQKVLANEFSGAPGSCCSTATRVRCRDEDAGPILGGDAEHGQRFGEVPRTVVEPGEDMRVEIDSWSWFQDRHRSHPFPLDSTATLSPTRDRSVTRGAESFCPHGIERSTRTGGAETE